MLRSLSQIVDDKLRCVISARLNDKKGRAIRSKSEVPNLVCCVNHAPVPEYPDRLGRIFLTADQGIQSQVCESRDHGSIVMFGKPVVVWPKRQRISKHSPLPIQHFKPGRASCRQHYESGSSGVAMACLKKTGRVADYFARCKSTFH